MSDDQPVTKILFWVFGAIPFLIYLGFLYLREALWRWRRPGPRFSLAFKCRWLYESRNFRLLWCWRFKQACHLVEH